MDSPNPSSLSSRTDELKDDKGHHRPGSLEWEVGYFTKTTLEQQFEAQGKSKEEVDQWKNDVEQEAEDKLREGLPEDNTHASELASNLAGRLSSMLGGGKTQKENAQGRVEAPREQSNNTHESEIAQQKSEDLKEKTDEFISSSSPPTDAWPSGILSILIESISGLEVEKIRETGVNPDNNPEEQQGDAGVDGGDNMPSSYCVVVLNHEKVYKTRVKMKSSNPYVSSLSLYFSSYEG